MYIFEACHMTLVNNVQGVWVEHWSMKIVYLVIPVK
jgi:hypothetical protein